MSRFLIDTHVLVWWWLDQPMLSRAARELLRNGDAQIRVSAVTAFELGQKVRLGKLPAMAEPLADYDANLQVEGMSQLAVTGHHALLAGTMEGKHRDPFDRMIVAQAMIEDLTVITADPAIAAFGCKVLW